MCYFFGWSNSYLKVFSRRMGLEAAAAPEEKDYEGGRRSLN